MQVNVQHGVLFPQSSLLCRHRYDAAPKAPEVDTVWVIGGGFTPCSGTREMYWFVMDLATAPVPAPQTRADNDTLPHVHAFMTRMKRATVAFAFYIMQYEILFQRRQAHISHICFSILGSQQLLPLIRNDMPVEDQKHLRGASQTLWLQRI